VFCSIDFTVNGNQSHSLRVPALASGSPFGFAMRPEKKKTSPYLSDKEKKDTASIGVIWAKTRPIKPFVLVLCPSERKQLRAGGLTRPQRTRPYSVLQRRVVRPSGNQIPSRVVANSNAVHPRVRVPAH
jgi:hypothetical protein